MMAGDQMLVCAWLLEHTENSMRDALHGWTDSTQ